MKIIVVNGLPHSGKSTFENYCLKHNRDGGACISSIDFVKYLANKCGWTGEKTPETRKFLSDLKSLLTNSPFGNVPQKAVLDEIDTLSLDAPNRFMIFVDIREPEQIQDFVEKTGATTIKIERDEGTDIISNTSDANVDDYKYDYVIKNNGTLEQLELAARDFLMALEIRDTMVQFK